MNQYLLSILKEQNTIIIPGIGALTITDPKTGEIMFMPYLKHDDGKLAEYIASHDNIDKTDAQNIIAKYVREIENILNKGEEYSMYEFGTFLKENDEIIFKNWEKKTVKTNQEKPEIKEEEIVIPIIPVTPSTPVTPKVEETKTTPVREPSKKTESKEKLVDKNVFKPKKELNILEKEEKLATQSKLDKLKEGKNKPTEKKKINGAKLVLVLLIAMISVGGVYFGMNYDSLKQHIPFLADNKEEVYSEKETEELFEEEKIESPTEESFSEADDSIEKDDTEEVVYAEEDNYEEEDLEINETNVSTTIEEPLISGDYSVVVGSFQTKENAIELCEKLKQGGYSASVNSQDGNHRVAIKSFSSKQESINYRETILGDFPSAWVKRN